MATLLGGVSAGDGIGRRLGAVGTAGSGSSAVGDVVLPRGGSYQLVVDLWIDPSRTIQRTQLLRSTGDQKRDAAVTAALQGLTVSRMTPATASQPVRIAIRVKSFQ